ncbi:MAG: malonate decarboxylase holo-[acyl-carrier-protein] synthase [Peptococcaceae bacterium]
MLLQRHYLLEISRQGRYFALKKVLENSHYYDINRIEQLILGGTGSRQVPGIVRREENKKLCGTIAVGFSSPDLYEGQRLRVPSFIPEDAVEKIITPYDLLKRAFSLRTKCLRALHEVAASADRAGINLGIWGSAALEVYTSLPYTREESDLDLVITGADFQRITSFYRVIREIASYYMTTIDLEIDIGGYGIKAAELFMETDQVLAKSISRVDLLAKDLVVSQIKK